MRSRRELGSARLHPAGCVGVGLTARWPRLPRRASTPEVRVPNFSVVQLPEQLGRLPVLAAKTDLNNSELRTQCGIYTKSGFRCLASGFRK